ncbi:MAG: glycosyltransferase family 39 protein [Candidatus Eremiobacteraeota bacterium]|nr:glycosyltransferase family 39 protein [Candidatus Eremiobacteraeota bacterium]
MKDFISSVKLRAKDLLHNKGAIYFILLCVFIVLIVINNLNWLKLDNNIPIDDQASHIYNSYYFFHKLNAGDFRRFLLECRFYYPPLVYQLSALFFLFTPQNPDLAVLSQIPFWAILILSIFFIGKHLWSYEVGFLAGIAAFGFPYMLTMSQSYLLDLPCAAMVSLCLLFLLLSEYFQRSAWTIAFFIAFAFSMLTKWSSIFYILLLLIIYFAIFIRNAFKEKKSPWMLVVMLVTTIFFAIMGLLWIRVELANSTMIYENMLRSYFISIVPLLVLFVITSFLPFVAKSSKRFVQGVQLFIIGIWHSYAIKFFFYVRYFNEVTTSGIQEGDTFSITWFLKRFTLEVQGIPWMFFLIIGILWYIFTRDKRNDRTIYIIGFLGSLAILFCIQDKEPRYFLPLVVYTSVILTYWIIQIKWKPLRVFLSLVLIVVAIPGIVGWRHEELNEYVRYNKQEQRYYNPIIAEPPRKADWQIDEIVGSLDRNVGNKATLLFVALEGHAAGSSSPNFMRMALNRDSERQVLIPWLVGGMEAEGFVPDQRRRFKFFIIIPDFEGDYIFDSVLILYFEDKSKKVDNKLYFRDILSARGFTGKLREKSKLKMPGNTVLHFIELKIEPPMCMQEIKEGIQD